MNDLRGWQAIADYVGVTIRHAMRLRRTRGLPVQQGGLREPYALTSQLDAWLKTGVADSAPVTAPPPTPNRDDLLRHSGGALPLGSALYVARPTDAQVLAAVSRRESVILLKGPRQTGKSSLLARCLQACRDTGTSVLVTDFQKLGISQLTDADAFYRCLGGLMLDQLGTRTRRAIDAWNTRVPPNVNFERFVRCTVLAQVADSVVWALDEVDRIFGASFASDVFSLFRSWHNERALEPNGAWAKLTLVMAYAAEPHGFISDMRLSPFNIGARFALDDMTVDEVRELNRRHGSPIRADGDVLRLHRLLGGQPYLTQRALEALRRELVTLPRLEADAANEIGLFGDHLRRMWLSLSKDAALLDAVRVVLQTKACPVRAFYALRSGGIVVGFAPDNVRVRSVLYEQFLRPRLATS